MAKPEYIIECVTIGRPDLKYYYAGNTMSGEPILKLVKSTAKGYDTVDSAQKIVDMLIKESAFISINIIPIKRRKI
jgi:hypothetical protein